MPEDDLQSHNHAKQHAQHQIVEEKKKVCCSLRICLIIHKFLPTSTGHGATSEIQSMGKACPWSTQSETTHTHTHTHTHMHTHTIHLPSSMHIYHCTQWTPSGSLLARGDAPISRQRDNEGENESTVNEELTKYVPFGRPGGGAPLKSHDGHVDATMRVHPETRFQKHLKREVENSLV